MGFRVSRIILVTIIGIIRTPLMAPFRFLLVADGMPMLNVECSPRIVRNWCRFLLLLTMMKSRKIKQALEEDWGGPCFRLGDILESSLGIRGTCLNHAMLTTRSAKSVNSEKFFNRPSVLGKASPNWIFNSFQNYSLVLGAPLMIVFLHIRRQQVTSKEHSDRGYGRSP
ncbi:hypothetical protein F5051DRAFT_73397 [Lentinula edodes]|nr:hypothetical protein F5051DRAFT_73397 [Lentinula edodes]